MRKDGVVFLVWNMRDMSDEVNQRSLSGSYSLKSEDKNFREYMDELAALFEQYAQNNVLTIKNKTIVYWGKMN